MATLLSRIPFDTSAINASFSKLNEYWRPSEMPQGSTIAPTSTVYPAQRAQPEGRSVPRPAGPNTTGQEVEGSADNEEFDFQQPSTSSPQQAADVEADKATGDKAGIAELIAQYGSSSATSWLEFARYKIWRPSVPIPQSSFPPVQGYLRSDPFVFAWGNPIVSDPSALEATCAAFIEWARSQKLRPIWLCVDGQMEKVLGGVGSKFGWSALSCIVEDFLDPRSVVELAHSHGGGSEVKDFKKNLRRAERENVQVREVQADQWSDAMKRQVEEGIANWKKSKTGIQIASVSSRLELAAEKFRGTDVYISLRRHHSSHGSTLSTGAIGLPRRARTLSASSSSPAFTTPSTRSRTRCLSPMRPAAPPKRSFTVPCRTFRTRASRTMSQTASRKTARSCGQIRTSKSRARSRRTRVTRARRASTRAVPTRPPGLTAPPPPHRASRRHPRVRGAVVSQSRSASRRPTRSRPSTI